MRVVSIIAFICAATPTVTGFTVPHHAGTIISSSSSSSSSALNVQFPRLNLPDAVGEKLDEFDLKNPNEMDTSEYNNYSGAAIGGTLLFFLFPGAIVSGILGALGGLLSGILFNFALSAAIGGGLAIYLSLRLDEIGESIRSAGYGLYQSIRESGLPVIPRQQVPDVVGEKAEEFDLMNINDMSDEEYDGYAGAAVAGTLLFFALPGLFISGLPGLLTEGLLPAIVSDAIFSVIVGGGLAIYLSLRKDEIGDTISGFGSSLVDVVDGVFESSEEEVIGSLAEDIAAEVSRMEPTPPEPEVKEQRGRI